MDLLDRLDYLDGFWGSIRPLTRLGSCLSNTPSRYTVNGYKIIGIICLSALPELQ